MALRARTLDATVLLEGVVRMVERKTARPTLSLSRRIGRRVGVVLLLCGFIGAGLYVNRDEPGLADAGVREHEQFTFEATLAHAEIRDGTAPFDASSTPGNDSSATNGIVRSFDTVTYPVKITVNPKNVERLNNIVVRLSGTLDGAVSDGRVNARYAVGGYASTATSTVGFTQEYTIPQTGSAVMVPIALEVQGARNGTVLRPRITVQVISVDGTDVAADNITTTFTSIPQVTVSSRVNLKAEWSNLDFIRDVTLSSVVPGDSDDWLYKRGIALGLQNLPGKTDARGTTFPTGRITYDLRVTGWVDWETSPDQNLNFTGVDDPIVLFDHQPENDVNNKVGNRNTEMDGRAYFHWAPYTNTVISRIHDYNNPANVTRWAQSSVWDAGAYTVNPVEVSSSHVRHTGHVENYFIGNTFPIYRTDGYTGHLRYSENDKIFSTNNFLFRTPNQYRAGAELNPTGEANNVYYTITFTLVSYDDDGVTVPVNQTYVTNIHERNTLVGSFGVNNTFFGISDRDLGSVYPGDEYVSTGDPKTVIGEDVLFYSYVNYYTIFYGGMQVLYRWNPDSFELTQAYAERAKREILQFGYANKDSTARVRNNYAKHTIRYGVQRNTSTALADLARYTHADYRWFDSYDEAVASGDIAAIENDIRDAMGTDVYYQKIPLRVKTRAMGSLNEHGTPNMAFTTTTVYGNESRTVAYAPHVGRTVTRATEYNANGEITRLQSPVGHGVNFETLGVGSAELSSTVTSDKATYYNSDTARWTVRSSLLLPSTAGLDTIDDGVTATVTLPRGLDYKLDTARVGGVAVEPDMVLNVDGTKTLTWQMRVSHADGTLPDITFETTMNPTALGTGVSSSQTVVNVLSSPLDNRTAGLRTASRSITILKVGMVGVHEAVDKTYGGKNSAFTLTLAPFTTVDDERDATGLALIPHAGDRYGSQFAGTTRLSALTVTGASSRRYAGAVRVWLNNNAVYAARPHEVNTATGGWYLYTGGAQDISNARTVLFRVEGLLAATDAVRINLRVQTAGNAFGDTYQNETVLNSATNYGLSPVSNRVRYQIRADAEMGVERLRVYTDTRDNGLPATVRVALAVMNAPALVGETVTLGVYDKTTGIRLGGEQVAFSDLQRETALRIPVAGIPKGGARQVEVRLEAFNADKVWVRDGADRIDTDGHVATERVLGSGDRDASGALRFTGVVMTERSLGQAVVRHHERIVVPPLSTPRVKAGYAFTVAPRVTYENDILDDVVARLGIETTTPARYNVDRRLIDKTLAYYEESALAAAVPLIGEMPVVYPNGVSVTYALPEVFLSRETGTMFTGGQVDAGDAPGVIVPAGSGVYVPTWVERTGEYGVAFRSERSLGSHRIGFNQEGVVDVHAYMLSHTDSETPDADELLIRPLAGVDDPFAD